LATSDTPDITNDPPGTGVSAGAVVVAATSVVVATPLDPVVPGAVVVAAVFGDVVAVLEPSLFLLHAAAIKPTLMTTAVSPRPARRVAGT
jgi:hypothetical protein